mmetsp:Transcript_23005/g.78317  ORF Transcript_23005/g.78317 Transcript_23005/m.78317 type:complete len:350 (+) Transcript_23005:3-1052(+)
MPWMSMMTSPAPISCNGSRILGSVSTSTLHEIGRGMAVTLWSDDDYDGDLDAGADSDGMAVEPRINVDDFLPAVLRRPVFANHIMHESITVETTDFEDHTFCGMMFDVRCTDELPIERLDIISVAVRGALGPMTVYMAPNTFRGKANNKDAWTLVYEGEHERSHRRFVPLQLPTPIHLAAGESCGIFVHSARPGDSAVVYDNFRGARRGDRERGLLTILPGMAALDCRPFGNTGLWGEGFRDRREFVGEIEVGVRWRLWNPECHDAFSVSFRRAARCLLLCATRQDCIVHALSDAVLFYVLNMCRWDWFEPPASEVTVEDVIVQGTTDNLMDDFDSEDDSDASPLLWDD